MPKRVSRTLVTPLRTAASLSTRNDHSTAGGPRFWRIERNVTVAALETTREKLPFPPGVQPSHHSKKVCLVNYVRTFSTWNSWNLVNLVIQE